MKLTSIVSNEAHCCLPTPLIKLTIIKQEINKQTQAFMRATVSLCTLARLSLYICNLTI